MLKLKKISKMHYITILQRNNSFTTFSCLTLPRALHHHNGKPYFQCIITVPTMENYTSCSQLLICTENNRFTCFYFTFYIYFICCYYFYLLFLILILFQNDYSTIYIYIYIYISYDAAAQRGPWPPHA